MNLADSNRRSCDVAAKPAARIFIYAGLCSLDRAEWVQACSTVPRNARSDKKVEKAPIFYGKWSLITNKASATAATIQSHSKANMCVG